MKVKLQDHNFFTPVLNQISKLLDKKYEIEFDSTESSITGPTFSVRNKKFKHHGIHVKMNLSSEGEIEINSYFSTLFPINPSRYSITPEKDKDNFPLLSEIQIITLDKKINAIEKRTLMDIKELADDLINNALGLSKNSIQSLHAMGDGLDLRIFDTYGLKVDYEGYLLSPSRDMLTNYRLVEVIFNSNDDKKVKAMLPDIINMYIGEAQLQETPGALKSMRRFGSDITKVFNKDNEDTYIEMVKSMYRFDEGYEFDPDLDGWTIHEFLTIPNNDRIKSQLDLFFYENTKDTHFLSDEAKDIFLF